MVYLLSVLPLLACPIVMGLMIWWMGRGHTVQAPQTTGLPPGDQHDASEHAPRAHAGICLNWKVAAGLAALGAVVWTVVPAWLRVVGPMLFVLACPISMFLMRRGTGHGTDAGREPASSEALAASSPRSSTWKAPVA